MSETQEAFQSAAVPPDSQGIVLASPVPPSGGLVHHIADFIAENLKPSTAAITDTITGSTALIEVSDDGVSQIDPSIFDGYLDRPRYREGFARVTTLKSLIDHTNRFKDGESVIYANDDRTAPSLTSVLDYNPAGGRDTHPDFGHHRTVYAFPLSDEWKAWHAKDKEKMSMVDFANFLEDRVIDVMAPGDTEISGDQLEMVNILGGQDRLASPSRLIELSRGLQVYENAVINESHKLSSGEGEITFTAEHTDGKGAPLIVPTCFLLAIPVFRGDPPYQVLARLRYRAPGGTGGLTFWYELWRTDRVFDHAFAEAADKAVEATGLPVFYGTPEV